MQEPAERAIIRGTAENLRKALDGDAIGTSIEPDAAKQ